MAVPEKKPVDLNEDDIKEAILEAVAELYDEHRDQIVKIRNRSEVKCISVNFSNEINCSESQAVVETKIKFSENYTDKRTNKISRDDSNQLKLETVEHAGKGGRNNKPAEAGKEGAAA